MTVYVIQKGYYSDMHIVGVTATREAAEKVAHAVGGVGGYDQTRITEYDTDQFVDTRFRYTVYYYHGEWIAEYDESGIYSDCLENELTKMGELVVDACSPEQAIKIAQDVCAAKKAAGVLPDNFFMEAADTEEENDIEQIIDEHREGYIKVPKLN